MATKDERALTVLVAGMLYAAELADEGSWHGEHTTYTHAQARANAAERARLLIAAVDQELAEAGGAGGP